MSSNNEMIGRVERQTTYTCSCGEGFTSQQFSIQCDSCKEWFHGICVQLQDFEAEEIDKFFCPKCQLICGQSIYKEITNNHRHNRTELNPNSKPTQSGTNQFIQNLKNQIFSDAKNDDSVIRQMRGQQITFKELLLNGFEIPILVESKDGLELTVPSTNSFSFDSILNYFSSDYELDVIDVKRQLNIKMKTKDFVNHFKTDIKERNNVYNCISLEVSQSSLSNEVRPPSIVNKLSWVENYWPKVETRPAVSKYCLISMQDSFTDFHIDFGGTSVWYHVLKGEKVFYIIKPTKENLEKYENWMISINSSEKFFATCVDECFKLNLTAGQTLFIPTGWIHAVLTPQDSIVFGGNFLHSLNIQLQLQIREMEQRIKTPDKFQFPFFELTHWYAAPNVLKLLQDSLKQCPPKHLVVGVTALIPQLRLWHQKSKSNQLDYQILTLAPRAFNCTKLIKDLNQTLKKAIRKLEGQPIVKKRGKSYKSFNLESSVSPITLVQTTAKIPDKKNSQKRTQNSDNDKESQLELDDEKSLVVDDSSKSVTKRLRTSSTESESKGGLKLKLSIAGAKGILGTSGFDSNIDSYFMSNELSNNSNNNSAQIAALKSTSNLLIDNSSESHKKQKTKRKRKKIPKDNQIDEEIESMVKGRPEDDNFIYLDLETPDDEESKNRPKINARDESWSPKAKLTIRATPKPPRPTRDNAKRDVVESSIANAAAKMENKPQPKRPYNRKKQKRVKSSTVSDEYKLSDSLINFEDNPSVSSTLVNNASNSNPSLSSSKLSVSSLSQNVTLINKKPKKGLATPKQRIAKKLKMTTNRFNSFSN
jgi:hypothetical protein